MRVLGPMAFGTYMAPRKTSRSLFRLNLMAILTSQFVLMNQLLKGCISFRICIFEKDQQKIGDVADIGHIPNCLRWV